MQHCINKFSLNQTYHVHCIAKNWYYRKNGKCKELCKNCKWQFKENNSYCLLIVLTLIKECIIFIDKRTTAQLY